MNDQDKHNGTRPLRSQKKAGGIRAAVWLLLVLAILLCLVLFMTTWHPFEKRAGEKVTKKIAAGRKKIQLAVPSPETEVKPWPTEGPLPDLAPPGSPVKALRPFLVGHQVSVKPQKPLKVSEVTKGRLRVNAEPKGSTIKILNIRPQYRRDMALNEGRYHLLVSHAGYQSKSRWVQILRAKDNTIFFKLTRKITAGSLFVQTSPPGAHWFLDGKSFGTTPDSRKDVPQGDHLVTVKMDGYEPWTQTIVVRAGENAVVEAVLTESGPMPGQVWHEPVTGMAFVWVPKGCFYMGSPLSESGRDPDEGPVHEVCVDGFWMGATEVTNGQYHRFDSVHESKAYNGQSLNGETQPVVHVSWTDANAFARWLTQRDGGDFTFRLPTEAEWEYACRSGSKTARFWGDNPDDACRFANVYDRTSSKQNDFEWTPHNCDDGFSVTSPVGAFGANAFGLHDMLGNVWEWCQDTYGENIYAYHRKDNPIHIGPEPFRVNRGGGWTDIARSVRCAVRERLDPEFGNLYVGFRLIRKPLKSAPYH